MMPTHIHLIRHGEVHNPERVLYGRLPRFRLSAEGRRQARAAGRFLRAEPLQAVFSSPLLRARQTAEEILTFFPRQRLRISRRLNEVYTAYEGLPGDRVDALRGDIYSGVATSYEQPADIVARVFRFIGQTRRSFAGSHVAAVTHGDVITFTVLWARGRVLSPQNKTRLKTTGYPAAYPAHASITTLTFNSSSGDERPTVAYVQPWQ